MSRQVRQLTLETNVSKLEVIVRTRELAPREAWDNMEGTCLISWKS